MGTGARSAALGGAFTGVPGGLDSLSINPAGLAFLDRPEAVWHHHSWIGGTTRENVSLAGPSRVWGVAAGTFQFLLYKNMEARDEEGNITGTLRTHREDLSLAWARAFGRRLAFGAAVRQSRLSLAGEDVVTFAGDGGFLLRMGRGWNLGGAVNNAATYLDKVASSSFYRLGLSRSGRTYLVAASFMWQPDGVPYLQGGLERTFARTFSARLGARGGLKNDRIDGFQWLTCGFGWNPGAWALDYAYEPMGEFGASHRVSLRMALASKSAPLPVAASPTTGFPAVSATSTATPAIPIIPTATVTPTLTPIPPSALGTPKPPKDEKGREKERLRLFFELPEESPSPTPSPKAAGGALDGLRVRPSPTPFARQPASSPGALEELLDPGSLEKAMTPGVK